MIEEKLYSAFGAATLTQGLVLLIEIKKKLKDYCGLFKKSPARCSNCLEAIDYHDSDEGMDVYHIYFRGNFVAFDDWRILKFLQELLTNGTTWLERKKSLSLEDEILIGISKAPKIWTTEVIWVFSLYYERYLEPFLELFQVERPLAVILFEELRAILFCYCY